MYLQQDGVAMGLLLGPVGAGIFMVNPWKKYYSIALVKLGSVEIIFACLNNVHPNIEIA